MEALGQNFINIFDLGAPPATNTGLAADSVTDSTSDPAAVLVTAAEIIGGKELIASFDAALDMVFKQEDDGSDDSTLYNLTPSPQNQMQNMPDVQDIKRIADTIINRILHLVENPTSTDHEINEINTDLQSANPIDNLFGNNVTQNDDPEAVGELHKLIYKEVYELGLSSVKNTIQNKMETVSQAITDTDVSEISKIISLADELESLESVQRQLERIHYKIRNEYLDLGQNLDIDKDRLRTNLKNILEVKLNNIERAVHIPQLLDLNDIARVNILDSLESLHNKLIENTTEIKNFNGEVKNLNTDVQLSTDLAKSLQIKIGDLAKVNSHSEIAKNDQLEQMIQKMNQELGVKDEIKIKQISNQEKALGHVDLVDRSNIDSKNNRLFVISSSVDSESHKQNHNQNQERTDTHTQILKIFQGLSAPQSETTVKENRIHSSELRHLLPELVSKAPDNSSSRLELKLNPRELGNLEIQIVKEHNHIEIKVVVETDTALKILKQEMSDLTAILKSKGVSVKDIEVSKSDSSMLDQSSRGQSDSYNEARDEQKKRFLNTAPAWFPNIGSYLETSFETTIKGILT